MKKHNGFRPHDLLVLLKIVTIKEKEWKANYLANSLMISASEVSESLNRSLMGGLLKRNKREVIRHHLYEFIVYGFKYVYPVNPGSTVRGVPTAHSASPLNRLIDSTEIYVWSWPEGTVRGKAIEPLHKYQPAACQRDPKLYELMALVDAIRVGKVRELELAASELKKRILF